MKIGIVTDPYLESIGTSMHSYIKNLIENLLKTEKCNEICLIHSKKSNSIFYNNQYELLIPEFHLPLPYGVKNFYLPFLLEKHNFDVVHYPTGMPFFSWMNGSRNVTTLHSVASLIVPQYYSKISQLTWIVRKMDFERMDKIITVSVSEKENITRILKIPAEKIKEIYHGLDHEKFKPLTDVGDIRQDLNNKYGISAFILQVANLFPVKNINSVIWAFYKLKQKGVKQKLVIAGGKRKNYEVIIKIVRELNLQKEVLFVGSVPEDELVKLYNTADLFVFPSLYESFGMPILEAMACGAPVITSNVYAMPEIAGDAAVLVNPHNVNEITDAMYKILTNDGLKDELIRKGLKRAKMFTWEKCAEETLNVYEDLSSDK